MARRLTVTNIEWRKAKERQSHYRSQGINKSLKICFAEIYNEHNAQVTAHMFKGMLREVQKPDPKEVVRRWGFKL